jgi:FAD/FMN-containing dehydrogenase
MTQTTETTPVVTITEAIERLRSALTGRLITPGDADYDGARSIVLGGVDPRPAVIARAADAEDVARVVSLARELDLELAVRSGGHSGAGHSTIDDGLVLDLRDLDDLEVDVDGRTAWVGAGLTAAAITTALGEHGLAIGFGDTGSVGVGGITTGGGVGYLGRKFGLTIDSLLAADVVTADGRVRRVDAESEPDLFWAIRGGGGNVGVATRFRFRLREVPSIVGGMLILPATVETVAGFIAAARSAPDELSTIANVMPCPPMPFVPVDRHGELVIFAIVAYAGDTTAGEAAIAPLRALATPLADMVQEMPYSGLYQPDDPDYHPTAVAVNLFMDHIGPAEAETILDHLGRSDASMRVAQLRVLGGAIAGVPADATAYAHRSLPIMVNLAAFYEGEDDRRRRQAWLDDFVAALDQGIANKYVNFVGDEGEAGVRAAYPGATWDRLADIKRRYDPTNLFRRNQNVPPAEASR